MTVTHTAIRSVALAGESGPLTAGLEAALAAAEHVAVVEPAGAQAVLVGAVRGLAETQQLVQDIAKALGPETIIAVATDLLSVTEVALGVERPERVVGIHHFTGGHARGSVEIVPGQVTSAACVGVLVDLVNTLDGLVAIVVKDRPGLLLNSLFVPYLNDVIAELDDELASARDLDVALELGLGYRTGPLALIDWVGAERHLETTQALYAATGDSRYAPPPLLRRIAATGQLFRADLTDNISNAQTEG